MMLKQILEGCKLPSLNQGDDVGRFDILRYIRHQELGDTAMYSWRNIA